MPGFANWYTITLKMNSKIPDSMEAIYKVGDRVFDIRYGWGTVIDITTDRNYPVEVSFTNNPRVLVYTSAGSLFDNEKTPTLSFTEYTLEGFSQERPKKQPKIGSLCLFADNEEKFKLNVGVIGILDDIVDGKDYMNTGGVTYKYCKQIKIEEV